MRASIGACCGAFDSVQARGNLENVISAGLGRIYIWLPIQDQVWCGMD